MAGGRLWGRGAVDGDEDESDTFRAFRKRGREIDPMLLGSKVTKHYAGAGMNGQ